MRFLIALGLLAAVVLVSCDDEINSVSAEADNQSNPNESPEAPESNQEKEEVSKDSSKSEEVRLATDPTDADSEERNEASNESAEQESDLLMRDNTDNKPAEVVLNETGVEFGETSPNATVSISKTTASALVNGNASTGTQKTTVAEAKINVTASTATSGVKTTTSDVKAAATVKIEAVKEKHEELGSAEQATTEADDEGIIDEGEEGVGEGESQPLAGGSSGAEMRPPAFTGGSFFIGIVLCLVVLSVGAVGFVVYRRSRPSPPAGYRSYP